MTHAADLPAWAALLTALFLLIGAGLTLIGSFGLLRLGSFYERVHAPTLGTTLGIGSTLIASMLFFSVLQTRLVVHELLIAVFTVLTTPVTLILLARVALYRDRREGRDEVPPLPHAPPLAGTLDPAALEVFDPEERRR
jgi:multicomponent K+:H+ antiporter subunit G